MSSPPILLLRHAESEWNASGRWQGHGDPPLSARGRGQAREAAESLAGSQVEVLVCSDLGRAVETASALGRVLGIEPLRDSRLRELHVGVWEGLTRAEITARHATDLARFDTGDPDARPTGGETFRELTVRVRAAVASLVERNAGRRLGVVTHLGVIRALAGVSEIENAGWCWVESETLAGDDTERSVA